MAKIFEEQFSLEITPVVNINGWFEYYFNFWWQNKPIFNPEIMRDIPIRGDEIMRESLVSLFEEAVKCQEDGKIFSWYSDNPDIELKIKVLIKDISPELNGGFDLEVFFNKVYFKGREDNSFGDHLAGVRVFQDRISLLKFSKDLRDELELSKSEAIKANPNIELGVS